MSTHNKMKSQLGDEEKMFHEGTCHTIMGVCQNPDLLIPTRELVRKKVKWLTFRKETMQYRPWAEQCSRKGA